MADNVLITAGSGTTIATDDAGAGGHVQVMKLAISTDGSATYIPADATNGLDVDVTRLPAPLSTTGGGTEAAALRVTLANDSTGVVSVDDNGASLTVDGTVAVSGTVTVGAHDVTNAGTFAVQAALTAGTNTNEVVGDIAHDTGVGGNPVQIAGAAQDTDDTAPPNRVSAEADVTRFATDRDGALFVRAHPPQVWTYHVNGSSALTDTSVHAAPGAGLSLYIGTITFSSGAATAINMFLEEGATTIVGPYYLEATAGRGMAVQFNPPRKVTVNTALTITTSAAIAHSVDITGFTAQG